jgi:thiosulfate/3-mercaptopyruvate sulfurtransferase
MAEQDNLLVETDWLAAHLHDPDVRVVDMRGHVRIVTVRPGEQEATYVGAFEEYVEGHIAGAVYVDWTRDIVDLDDPVEAQVASAEKFAQALGRLGIGDEHLVVAYDSQPSALATRLWWALTYYGHRRVAVLNGGLEKWQRDKLPLSNEVPSYLPAIFTPKVQPDLLATAEDVLAVLHQPETQLVDARDVAQYTGQVSRNHGREGHIPGAINVPREWLFAPDGLFRSEEELRAIFAEADVRPEKRVITYCNGGVAATAVLFGLALAGYPTLTAYDGSWNEWGSRKDLPTEIVEP